MSATLRQAEAATRRFARNHYENFVVASVLLPRRLRQPFYNLYAFCRSADDLADESPSPQEALRRLETFQQELDRVFEGRPGSPLFVALHHTVRQFGLPPGPFQDLMDAFRQDQRKTRYASFAELQDYCRRSANPVGRLVLRLGECFDESNAVLSDEICSGLQLANFCQDVGRDFAIGRIYLPADAMRSFGVEESMLAGNSTPDPLRRLLKSECDRAEGCFRRGLPLADRVPRWLSADVKLFAEGGMATLRAIRASDYDVLASRPTVCRRTQVGLLIRAALRLL